MNPERVLAEASGKHLGHTKRGHFVQKCRSARIDPDVPRRSCSASQSEHQLQARADLLHRLAGKQLNPCCKQCTVQGDYLRHVHHRRLWQAGFCLANANVARRVCQSEVGCNYSNDNRSNATFIERVGLDNEYWPAKSRARTSGLRQGSPPNLTTLHVPCAQLARETEALRAQNPCRHTPR